MYFKKPNFRSCQTVTAEGRTAVLLTPVLTCVPERDVQLQQGDVMATAVVRLFARWEASGICMVLSALGRKIVQQPTLQCLQGSQVTSLGFYRN